MSKFPTMSTIFGGVEDDYALSHERLMGRGRMQRVTEARHISMYLARTMLTERGKTRSFPVIGEALDRDHTTVMFGVARITERMMIDPVLATTVARIRDRLQVSG